MRRAISVTIKPHQILHLPRRMTRMLDRRHIWNVIYNARSNRCHHPTSPNTAPATKNDTATFQRKCLKTRETSFPMRGRSEHDPSMKPSVRNPPRNRGYFSSPPRAFSIVKYNVLRPILHSNIHQVLRLPRKVTLEPHQVLHLSRKVTLELHQILHLPRKVTLELHQILHLPRKVTLEPHRVLHLSRKVRLELHQILHRPRRMTRMLDRRHIWNVIYNARSNRCHHPTSPNTAPATKNDTATFQRKCLKTPETSFPTRGRSENDPRMIRAWSEHWHETVSPQPATQPRLLFEPTTSIFYCKIQRFAPNLTFQHSPNTAPTTKSDTWTSPSTAPVTKSNTWTSPSTAPVTKSETETSPNTAPATQNDSHAWSSSHMKRHLQCAEQQVSPSNLTKYCACHEKWHCNISKKMSENSWNVISNAGTIRAWSEHDPSMKPSVRNPPRNRGYFSSPPRAFSIVKYNVLRPILHSNIHQVLRLPRKVTLEPHQILHLPQKVTLELHQILHLPRKVTLEPHQVLHLSRKVTLELHQNLTKYCTCNEK